VTSGSLLVVVETPRDEQDAVLRSVFTPLVRELAASSSLDAVHFERFNKPQWGLGLNARGGAGWVDGEARNIIQRRLDLHGAPYAFQDGAVDDKWLGTWREREELEVVQHLDSIACLDVLEQEAAEGLGTSRAQWSLLVVEGLLDAFGLRDRERLEFYRRGFQWAPDSGRWDAEVFEALERKYDAQEQALRDVVRGASRDRPVSAWGGPEASRIAMSLLDRVAAPIGALDASVGNSQLEWAVLACRAHSNRLGIPAPQEATLRYLVWRARGGRRSPAL
jgi:hypothetical protein